MELHEIIQTAHAAEKIIDRHSPIPMYYQITKQIREKIEMGEYNLHNALPPERELVETYQVSRMTVRQAILELVNEGILIRRKGVGTFVAPPKLEQELSGLTSFTEDMAKRGMKAGARVISFGETMPDASVCEALNLHPHEHVYKCERLRLADDEPMALETTLIATSVCPGLRREDLENSSLYTLLADRWKVRLGHATQTLEPFLASPFEAKLLHVSSGSPLLLMHRVTFDQDGHAFEYVKSFYRGDRYKFVTELHRKSGR